MTTQHWILFCKHLQFSMVSILYDTNKNIPFNYASIINISKGVFEVNKIHRNINIFIFQNELMAILISINEKVIALA